MAEEEQESEQTREQSPKQEGKKTGGNGSHTIPVQML